MILQTVRNIHALPYGSTQWRQNFVTLGTYYKQQVNRKILLNWNELSLVIS